MLCHLRAVEKLGYADILEQALASSRLDHQLARQLGRLARLQRPELDRFIQWVSWDDCPVRKLLDYHGLAHGVSPEIRLEAEALDARDLDLEHGEGRAGLWLLEDDVRPSPHQHVVDGLDAVLRRVHFGQVDRLHDPG